jgi:O-antigen/teichoic acid export membrane protein
VRNLSISFATTAFVQAVNIATGLIAARLLLPEGRGVLAALMLWPGLIAELGGLGLSDALLYRLAAGGATPAALFATIAGLALALCAVLVPLGLVLLPWLMDGYDPATLTAAAWYLGTFLPAYFASLFVANMFQGRLELVAWNLVRAAVPAAYLAAIVALALVGAASAPAFAAANVAAMLASTALGLALLARRGWIGLDADRVEARALLVYGLKAHASEIISSLRQKLDQAVVARLMAPADLGLYAVALTVANGPLIFVQTVYNVALPRISGETAHERRVVVFGRFLRLALALVVAVDLALIALNPWLIPLLFGAPFADAVPVADLLLVGLVPFAAKIVFAVALKAVDRALAIPPAELWGLATIAVALVALVPPLGLIGAAAASVLAQLVSAAALGARLGRELGVNPLRLMVPTRDDFALLRGYAARALSRG